MLTTLLIVLLVLMLVGALPCWPYSTHWGRGPSSSLAVILLLVIILLLFGY